MGADKLCLPLFSAHPTRRQSSSAQLPTLTLIVFPSFPQPFHAQPYLFPEPLSFPLLPFFLLLSSRFQLLHLSMVLTISFALSLQVWGTVVLLLSEPILPFSKMTLHWPLLEPVVGPSGTQILC